MIDIDTLKSLLKRKGIYLLDNLEQVREVIADKFPGLLESEMDRECEKITQHCFMRNGGV